MKATIEFEDALYRRLKIEAARRGRTIRDLVADGVRLLLDTPVPPGAGDPRGTAEEWRPAWFGSLERYGDSITDHSMKAVRQSIARGRTSAPRP